MGLKCKIVYTSIYLQTISMVYSRERESTSHQGQRLSMREIAPLTPELELWSTAFRDCAYQRWLRSNMKPSSSLSILLSRSSSHIDRPSLSTFLSSLPPSPIWPHSCGFFFFIGNKFVFRFWRIGGWGDCGFQWWWVRLSSKVDGGQLRVVFGGLVAWVIWGFQGW